jgi:hypothetical protein
MLKRFQNVQFEHQKQQLIAEILINNINVGKVFSIIESHVISNQEEAKF